MLVDNLKPDYYRSKGRPPPITIADYHYFSTPPTSSTVSIDEADDQRNSLFFGECIRRKTPIALPSHENHQTNVFVRQVSLSSGSLLGDLNGKPLFYMPVLSGKFDPLHSVSDMASLSPPPKPVEDQDQLQLQNGDSFLSIAALKPTSKSKSTRPKRRSKQHSRAMNKEQIFKPCPLSVVEPPCTPASPPTVTPTCLAFAEEEEDDDDDFIVVTTKKKTNQIRRKSKPLTNPPKLNGWAHNQKQTQQAQTASQYRRFNQHPSHWPTLGTSVAVIPRQPTSRNHPPNDNRDGAQTEVEAPLFLIDSLKRQHAHVLNLLLQTWSEFAKALNA